MATYVVSDLHGQFDAFIELLKRISFSDADYMYVLGDAIDRGPHGIHLLQLIKEAPNMDLLIGNHEFMMLNSIALDGSVDCLPGRDADLWIEMNGGDITFEVYKELPEEDRKELIDWLRTRKVSTIVERNNKKYCLTHSFFKDDMIDIAYADCDPTRVFEAVWFSPFRYDVYRPATDYNIPECTFVIGHVPVQRVVEIMEDGFESYQEENIVLIDGGCALSVNPKYDKDAYGIICLCLDDMREITVSMEEVEQHVWSIV